MFHNFPYSYEPYRQLRTKILKKKKKKKKWRGKVLLKCKRLKTACQEIKTGSMCLSMKHARDNMFQVYVYTKILGFGWSWLSSLSTDAY